ncbi:efflux RND transporter permease subunit [Legionella dresdenensis]|uniref:Efflux RND transporter permease subunit n=1 Tax=Legionella dresdenensis TaxID=450200 RepID=A0ABV8CEK6_9GAMM
MKLTGYFIKHPVIAIIFNCLIAVIGIMSWHTLSVREYPEITFPTITISASYPNASPDLVETAVTNVLEDRLSGVEGLETITSQSSGGNSQITLAFSAGTQMSSALSAAQDAVNLAKPFLPSEVKSPIVERQLTANGPPFIAIALESTTLDNGQLTHFAHLRIKNEFRSLPGVASVMVWGQPYTYEITLDPKKLYAFKVNVDEVIAALNRSKITLPAGNYQNKIPSTLNSELKSKKDYENLLIKPDPAHPVLLKSIAKIDLTTDNNRTRVRVNGHPGLILSISRANDANPLEVSKAVRKELDALQPSLPEGIKARIIIDQSDFINASLKNIRSAITEAIILVLIIVFIFLRNIKATIIPLVTIPISLLGSLIFLKLFGYSINLMTLLAMVLAIGLVVDDAIIVLENIWRHIEQNQSPRNAAIEGAKEIGFAIVAMTFTLASVYMPIAFIDGMLGQLFIEFAVALAGSVVISGIVALTLSPLMCASLLSTNHNPLWPQFDHALERLAAGYSSRLDWLLTNKKWAVVAALASIIISALLFLHLPRETAPKEDRGLLGVYTPAAAGESIDQLDSKLGAIEKTLHNIPETQNMLAFAGSWGASIVLPLKAHNQRHRSSETIVNELRPQMTHFPSVDPVAWSWDSGLPGLDDAGSGSDLALIISTADDFRQLFNQMEKLKAKLESDKTFGMVRYDLRLDTPGYMINLDNNTLARLGLSASQVAKTIEVFFSGDKSLNFQKDGVIYDLTVKGSVSPWTLNELYLTTPAGKQVSLGALATMKPKAQPTALEHFRQMRSTTLNVQPAEGISQAQAMKKLWEIAHSELPATYKQTWTGSAKAQSESSNTMVFLFLLSLVFIYSILAIQFENFIDPLIILFTVPLACSGALLFAWLFNQSINIYSQVGLITLIGLISKHGILVVEFANQLLAQGIKTSEAIKQACVLRLRPILMTTGAMVFGAIPLVLAHNAGAESRHAIGIVLIGGLLLGTLFTLFVLPSIYCLVKAKR